jgi:hypothetical protein
MIREMPQWGNDIARSQMKQLGDRLIMGAKFMSKQGDNSGGSESREISQEEFENDDFGAVGEEGEYDSLAASGMEGTDPFNKDPLAPGNTELSAEDIGDDFERDSYDMNQDDPQAQYADDHNRRMMLQAQQLTGPGGTGMNPQDIQRIEDSYRPEMAPQNSPNFATGNGMPMDPRLMEEIQRAKMLNSGAPPGLVPQGRFQIPQTPYQGRRY